MLDRIYTHTHVHTHTHTHTHTLTHEPTHVLHLPSAVPHGSYRSGESGFEHSDFKARKGLSSFTHSHTPSPPSLPPSLLAALPSSLSRSLSHSLTYPPSPPPSLVPYKHTNENKNKPHCIEAHRIMIKQTSTLAWQMKTNKGQCFKAHYSMIKQTSILSAVQEISRKGSCYY